MPHGHTYCPRSQEQAKLLPGRIRAGCFMRSISLVRWFTDQATFPPPPGRLERARDTAIAEILERVNKGRRKRTYPRVIKKYKGTHLPGQTACPGRQAAPSGPEIRRPLVS
jgi:hypothetical protein